MATITTKFSIGETVYHAGTTTEKRRRPCPDCLGSKKWETTSPAGTKYTFDCPRCAAQYQSERDLALDYAQFAPCVSPLTIGSIQYNTAKGSYDEGARYMCRETGIGSGSVYSETDLFASEAEALEAAKAKADVQNVETPWVVVQYNKSLRLSDYQLSNAILELAKDEKSRAHSLLWNISDLFGRIEEAADKEEILEAVEDYKNYDWQRDKDKIAPSHMDAMSGAS
ncbi:hypothetical protein [Bradyrhizobium sp. Arg816]|uniref:hypothetical protein n=1 Tax=Bradyrhizobium sp. Arg816 TaxID=2998491 RepID=UPI00249EF579|nr:hypothetical protein [Bradyrhizobium sp. Arg816]MDI3563525.1 hypothetical protein [Bradyrhizobium sp. Arg816]